MSIHGGCLCKAVRYTSTADPKITRICWCRDCQYLASGNGTVNVFFPAETFTVTGTPQTYTSVADSGNVMRRRFCPICGTPLFTAADIRPSIIGVRAGSLDDPNIVQPTLAIWTSSAPRWGCIADSMPRVTHQPPPMA